MLTKDLDEIKLKPDKNSSPKFRTYYDLIYDLLVIVHNNELFGISKTRAVLLSRLSGGTVQTIFNRYLIKNELVKPKVTSKSKKKENVILYEITGKGLLYIQHYKEALKVYKELNKIIGLEQSQPNKEQE